MAKQFQEMGKSLEGKMDGARQSRLERFMALSALGVDSRLRDCVVIVGPGSGFLWFNRNKK